MSMEEKRPLPEGWEWTAIGDAATVNLRDRALRDMPDETEVTFVPMAAVDDVDGIIVAPQVRTLGMTRKGYTPFSEGDVLFAKITPCMENGKAAIARNLRNGLGFGSTEFHVMKPGDGVLAEWLYYFVRQSSFRGDAKANFSGTAGQLRVKKGFIEDYQIPLAPLGEQEHIVAEIEKQFTRLDQAVASLKCAQANLQRYKASVLKAACDGRLVPQDPNDEPAEKLLQRILPERRRLWEEQEWAKLVQKAQKKVAQSRRKAQRRPARLSDLEPAEWQDIPEDEYGRYLPKNDKWKEKYKEPASPDTAELPPLPEGWTWANLDQLSARITDGTHQPPKFTEEGIPFVFVKHIVGGTIGFENTKFISEKTYNQLNSRCPIEQGDILYSAVGSYGVAVPVWIDKKFSFQRHIAHIKPIYSHTTNYITLCLNSSVGQDQAHRVARGVAQKTVTLGDLSKFVIPFAPLEQQERIIAEVERRLSVIAANEKAIAADLARAERLRQSILQQAFSGKLVPQENLV